MLSNHMPCPPSEDAFPEDSMVFDIGSEQFSSDSFRMFDFKVKPCPKVKPHDWTQCPFAHCGERATRRDPLVFKYCGSACAEFRRTGACSRGDACAYSHGVFECWLHPSKYKTQMCSDVDNCKRLVCFFAHRPSELRSAEGSRSMPGMGLVQHTMHPPPLPSGQMVRPTASQALGSQQPPQPSYDSLSGNSGRFQGPAQGVGNQSSSMPSSQSSSSQNPLNMLVSALQQCQSSMPGVNMLQLLSAAAGGNTVQQQPDFAAAILQAQMQASLQAQAQVQMQAAELVRQMLSTEHLAPQQQQQLRPDTHDDHAYSGGGHSGPLSYGNSGSFANSGYFHSQPADSPPQQQQQQPAPPAAHPPSNDPSFWHPAPPPRAPPTAADYNKPSDAGAGDRVSSSLSSFDMWGNDPIWCDGKPAAGRPDRQPYTQAVHELCVESAPSSAANSRKLSPLSGLLPPLDTSVDELLEALPRNLNDLKLSDVTNQRFVRQHARE